MNWKRDPLNIRCRIFRWCAPGIYPASKGGLSVRSNLVLVCPHCNQKESDMTLAAFAKAYKLDREAAEARPSQLGKEF